MSNVYFMRPIGMDGPIKIGFSATPAVRLQAMASWSPIELEILGHVPASPEDEAFLHRCFSDLHMRCEWFRQTPELLATIEKILSAGTIEIVRGKLSPKSDGIKLLPARRSRKNRKHDNPVSAAIEFLGGTTKVSLLVGQGQSSVSIWKTRGFFPSHTFVVLKSALDALGYDAPDELWRMS